MNNNNKKHAKI